MKKIKMSSVILACLLTVSPLFSVALYAQSVNYEMVRISGGSFQMGESDTSTFINYGNKPVHTVTLSSFSIGKYEVTQELFYAVMGTNPSYFTAANGRGSEIGETDAKRPVENVSWYDAIVFCNKLSIIEGLTPAYSINGKTNPVEWGSVPEYRDEAWDSVIIASGSNGYRLPTEAQWEYACRAGTTTPWHSGTEEALGNYAWYSTNSGDKTHEVGKKLPNAFGLYDMHGNVLEWCWDWYGDYSSEAQTNPLGASSGSSRVRRSGGWGSPAVLVRSVIRGYDGPSGRDDYIGFRLARP